MNCDKCGRQIPDNMVKLLIRVQRRALKIALSRERRLLTEQFTKYKKVCGKCSSLIADIVSKQLNY